MAAPPAASWIDLGDEADFRAGVPTAVEALGWKLLVFRHGEGISVVENRCTHAATRLDTGRLDGCVVACPLHRARFDLRDGSLIAGPATRPLPTFPVRVEAGRLQTELAERPSLRPPFPPPR